MAITHEKATEMFGPVVFEDEHAQLRARRNGMTLDVYALAKKDGVVFFPLGFLLGDNSMHFKTDGSNTRVSKALLGR